jgi:hypothetical protein
MPSSPRRPVDPNPRPQHGSGAHPTNIEPDHFDLVVSHLVDTLAGLKVPVVTIEAIGARLAPLEERNDSSICTEHTEQLHSYFRIRSYPVGRRFWFRRGPHSDWTCRLGRATAGRAEGVGG